MPAFDPVRDAVLNSPVEQHNSSLVSPLASPSLTRRATDLSVLLNSEPTMPTATTARSASSFSHLMAPPTDDKLTSSEPLGRRYAGSSSRSAQPPYPSPAQAQAQHKRESPSPTRYAQQFQQQDSRYPNSRPSSSASSSNSNNVRQQFQQHQQQQQQQQHPRGNGKRPTSSPAMPPPPTPPSAAKFEESNDPLPMPTLPARSNIPYRPTKRITPAGDVLVPLTPQEIEIYKNFRGKGSMKLAAKRKRTGSDEPEDTPASKKMIGDVGVVVEHYNSRPDVGVVQRQESPIIGLKSFNNWVKSVLITRFAHPVLQKSPSAGYGGRGGRGKVLDMGCGKGGDMTKWAKARIREILCVDIADVSVDQARGRYESMNSRFDASFAALDCYTEPLGKAFSPAKLSSPVDVVSMQFCMHYAFESVQKARCMLDNVSRYLRSGGVFIGTIPNAEVLMSSLDAIPPDAEDLTFGNSVYKIKFEQRDPKPMFGHKYWFFLQDAVDDVPEYVVHWDNFVQMAAEYGLHPTYKEEFHTVFQEHQDIPEFKNLMVRMKVVDANGESAIDEDQWEAANIYIAFAFEKR
ncbi:mRNA capping methyltransferase [Ephemerocybe angulata]|uniref:mRNA cap guanine-N(7) methyltransferase n=1 Tax=Ephemerocybe angulata TaxID=980116 RepID=A0A8H6MFZ8_9AGAR|nr:mRNA capping methyltransferase [Tulosesus angulatus]